MLPSLNFSSLPPRRDLLFSISPNPAVTEKIFLFKESSGQDLSAAKPEWEKWQAANYCALIIDTTDSSPIKNTEYLKEIRTSFTNPIIRLCNLKDEDDVLDAMVLSFDGLMSPVKHLTGKEYLICHQTADKVKFLLIPYVNCEDDWAKVVITYPRLLGIADGAGAIIPQVLRENNAWFMGHESVKDQYTLKCLIGND